MTDWLEVGYVARAHGLRGEVGVKTFDPDSQALHQVERAVLRLPDGSERPMRIASIRPAHGEVLVTFAGVDSRTAAEALRGARVLTHRDDLPPPGPGEFFQGDLVGLAAVDEGGEPLGTVEEVWNTGPVPNLVIRGAGQELLVPFADEFVLDVDLAQRRVRVRRPDYLE